MSPHYSSEVFTRSHDWVIKYGGDVFPTRGSLEWFIRQHRAELIGSGELIVRRGAGGSLIGPGFGRLAVEILQRQTQKATG